MYYRTNEELAKTFWSSDFNWGKQYLLAPVEETELFPSHERLKECLEIYEYENRWRQQSLWSLAHRIEYLNGLEEQSESCYQKWDKRQWNQFQSAREESSFKE